LKKKIGRKKGMVEDRAKLRRKRERVVVYNEW